MYICLCNALRDKEISRAISDGASSVCDTFNCFGCKPVCGKCVPEIRQRLKGGDTPSQAG